MHANAINPNSSIAYYNLGVAYFNSGNKTLAIENYRKAAKLGDTDSQNWLKSKGYSW